ncbi:MAG: DUF308 domain-containing protein [Clostridia bacterium]|nr:DUF308 domain-containing protein [Clostridia bacterium]
MKRSYGGLDVNKAYTPLSMFVRAAGMLVTGILFFSYPSQTLNLAVTLIHVLLWLSAADNVLKWVLRKNEERPSLGHALLVIGLALFLTLHPAFLSSSVSIVFAVWILINAFARFLYFVQLVQTNSFGKIWTMGQALLYTVFALFILMNPAGGAASLTRVLGAYSLIRGFFLLVDAGREWLGVDIRGKRVRQRLRYKPSILLTALLPMRLLKELDDPDEETEIEKWTRRETILPNVKPDLEIFLHVGKKVAMGMGHVDIALGDTVYTYGCYDAKSNRLFGILSDGVFVKAKRDEYIQFCLKYAKKCLIGYGVVLTEEQKRAIQEKIASFLLESIPWIPTDSAPEQKQLQKDADGEFYKIGKGPYKTYNLLTTNCVAVANMLSGSGGVDLMNPQGIITPGTYCEFLDRQFMRKKSIVISRTVYR